MPRQLQPCGTHAAYRRHQRRSEQPCPGCVAAARVARAKDLARRNAPDEVVVQLLVGGIRRGVPRRVDVTAAVAQLDRFGLSASEIARRIRMHRRTVERHRARLRHERAA